jgi:5-methylcytosine-specific restriction endonuclease McrA
MKPRPEFDHIVPFCEGGLTVLENMRTLCHDCHTKRTADWHKERAEKRRLVAQPELFISPSLPARGEGD